eukprot:m.221997 g.221997  ORF g.221997 m.221997 type:complete len:255 (-) comp10691_c0_seq1:109-873(-)
MCPEPPKHVAGVSPDRVSRKDSQALSCIMVNRIFVSHALRVICQMIVTILIITALATVNWMTISMDATSYIDIGVVGYYSDANGATKSGSSTDCTITSSVSLRSETCDRRKTALAFIILALVSSVFALLLTAASYMGSFVQSHALPLGSTVLSAVTAVFTLISFAVFISFFKYFKDDYDALMPNNNYDYYFSASFACVVAACGISIFAACLHFALGGRQAETPMMPPGILSSKAAEPSAPYSSYDGGEEGSSMA